MPSKPTLSGVGPMNFKEISQTAYSSDEEPINSERAVTSPFQNQISRNSQIKVFEKQVPGLRSLKPLEMSNGPRPTNLADRNTSNVKSIQKKKASFQSNADLSMQLMPGSFPQSSGKISPGKLGAAHSLKNNPSKRNLQNRMRKSPSRQKCFKTMPMSELEISREVSISTQ